MRERRRLVLQTDDVGLRGGIIGRDERRQQREERERREQRQRGNGGRVAPQTTPSAGCSGSGWGGSGSGGSGRSALRCGVWRGHVDALSTPLRSASRTRGSARA